MLPAGVDDTTAAVSELLLSKECSRWLPTGGSAVSHERPLWPSILDNDILVAACSIEAGQALLTRNTDHFHRIKGLEIAPYVV
jgi:predicted nucleic acid-binding protein